MLIGTVPLIRVLNLAVHPAQFADIPLRLASPKALNVYHMHVFRFPNLAVANITRDSVREALSRGITADQVRVASCDVMFIKELKRIVNLGVTSGNLNYPSQLLHQQL